MSCSRQRSGSLDIRGNPTAIYDYAETISDCIARYADEKAMEVMHLMMAGLNDEGVGRTFEEDADPGTCRLSTSLLTQVLQ